MKYYLDITLLPDVETNLGFLWYKVYQQVHIALVDNKVAKNESAVAVSIVQYQDKTFPMGNKLRLLAATEEALQALNIQQWLQRLQDYCHTTSIKPVPNNVEKHVCFKRKLATSIHKKAAKRAKHLNKPYQEVLAYLKREGKSEKCDLPFITIESQTAKKSGASSSRFPLFIEQTASSVPIEGVFDCYGLSKTATVPWF